MTVITKNPGKKEGEALVIVIASGKGGTGKTTVATNLALHEARKKHLVFMDLDVEEPNAAIFLKPQLNEDIAVNKKVPQINFKKCTYCGNCARLCAFNALVVLEKDVLVFPEMCHSCGLCSRLCPEQAITEIDSQIGEVKTGTLPNITFYEGSLKVGEVSTPEVIAAVKEQINDNLLHILDAPPGASCSVIESLHGADFCILVAEPTPFGLSDLSLMVKLVKDMSIPAGIIINQYEPDSTLIDDFALENNIPVLAHIPFDPEIAAAYSVGKPFVNTIPAYQNTFDSVLSQVEELIKK